MLAEGGNEYSLKEFIEAGSRKVTPDDCANYVMNMSRKLPIAAAGQPMEL